MNREQFEKSKSLLGEETVEMLLQVHQDALWILENFGVGCQQAEIEEVFKRFEAEGLAIVYEDRVYKEHRDVVIATSGLRKEING